MTKVLVKILFAPLMIPLLLLASLVFCGKDKTGFEKWSLATALQAFGHAMAGYCSA